MTTAHNNIMKVENIVRELRGSLNHNIPAKDSAAYKYVEQRLTKPI